MDPAVTSASGCFDDGEEATAVPELRFNRFKCHGNVALSEDDTVATSTVHAWGGVAGTWEFGGGGGGGGGGEDADEGVHYFETVVEKTRLGFGVYIGVVSAAYKPHLRGQGMSSSMVPARSAFEYDDGYFFYAHSGDLVRGGRVAGVTGARARAGDVVGVEFDASAGTVAFFVNGERLPAAFRGVTGPLQPLVDVAMGSAVRLLPRRCRSTGGASLRASRNSASSLAYAGADPRGFSLDMEKVGGAERELSGSVPLMLARVKHEAVNRDQFVAGEVAELSGTGKTAQEMAFADLQPGAEAPPPELIVARRTKMRRRSVAALEEIDAARRATDQADADAADDELHECAAQASRALWTESDALS